MKVSKFAAIGCLAAALAATSVTTAAAATIGHSAKGHGGSGWAASGGYERYARWTARRDRSYFLAPAKTTAHAPSTVAETVPGVPVPAAGLLLIAGLGGLAMVRRRG